jgi:pimeloyl-ACP methyl ester carboxylesterase/class 3 adenylate cyclase
MGVPKTQFATAPGNVSIAYQVFGEGPADVVWLWGLASSIEVAWEEPSYAAFLRRLGEVARVILYDRRGCGASDREGATATATLEERVEDLIAVLDAVGSEKPCLFGVSEGGALAAVMAAAQPARTSSIIVYGTMARFVRDDEHPWGWGSAQFLATFYESLGRVWGTTEGSHTAIPLWAPSLTGDERFAEWMAKHSRSAVSRNAVLPMMRSFDAYDLVDIFPMVRVPTLVLHRADDVLVPVSHGRWIADRVPNARYVELPGIDHLPFVGDAEGVLAEVEAFVNGDRPPLADDRRLLAVVVIDAVDRDRWPEQIGHSVWREHLAAYNQVVRDHVARFDAVTVNNIGTRFVAAFEGPARALRCSLGVISATERLGLSLRVGAHVGECELMGDDVVGVVPQVSAGLADAARSGEILASETVRDLVAGSGIRFGHRRDVELSGASGRRSVLPVLVRGESPESVRRLAVEQSNVFRRDGEYWTVAFDGRVSALRDTKGMRDLARLLDEPDREHHVSDLAATESGAAVGPSTARGAFDPMVDDTARAQYRRRLSELDELIDDADMDGDVERSAAAIAEREALVAELSRAYGIGGHVRHSPDHIERARKAVTRRMRDAMARIDQAHPTLGRHLQSAVHTGVFCSYSPEREISWRVEMN